MSVERVERKGGVVWRVRWRDEQGQARSKVVGRKRDAEAFEAEVVRRKRTGDLDLLTGGRETLADFAEEWWKLYAVPNLAARTLRSYAGLWDRHVLPRLGSMRLNAITPEVIERFRVELEAGGVGQPDDLSGARASPGHPAASGRVAADRPQSSQGSAEAEGPPPS